MLRDVLENCGDHKMFPYMQKLIICQWWVHRTFAQRMDEDGTRGNEYLCRECEAAGVGLLYGDNLPNHKRKLDKRFPVDMKYV
jgi:hypothetical protein